MRIVNNRTFNDLLGRVYLKYVAYTCGWWTSYRGMALCGWLGHRPVKGWPGHYGLCNRCLGRLPKWPANVFASTKGEARPTHNPDGERI